MRTARTPTVFHVWRWNSWTVLTVSGDLDDVGVQELERQFAAAAAYGVFLAIDLSHATVVGDSLDDVLSGMDRLLRAFGGRLTVLGRRARVVDLTRARSRSGVSLSS